jgi:hypothetical protein
VLSRDQLRVLRAVEQQLEASDPRLASILSGQPLYERRPAVRPVLLWMLAFDLVGLALGVGFANPVVATAGGILAVFHGWLLSKAREKNSADRHG